MDGTICLKMVMAAAATSGIPLLSTRVCNDMASKLIAYDGNMKEVVNIRPRREDVIVDYIDNYDNWLTYVYVYNPGN